MIDRLGEISIITQFFGLGRIPVHAERGYHDQFGVAKIRIGPRMDSANSSPLMSGIICSIMTASKGALDFVALVYHSQDLGSVLDRMIFTFP